MTALDDLKAEIEEAAREGSLPLSERVARLESIAADLQAGIDLVDAKIAEAEADPDAQRPGDILVAISALRTRAEVAQEQLDAGAITESELTEAGIYTSAELDTFDSEGLLEQVAQELIADGRIDVETGEWVLSEV